MAAVDSNHHQLTSLYNKTLLHREGSSIEGLLSFDHTSAVALFVYGTFWCNFKDVEIFRWAKWWCDSPWISTASLISFPSFERKNFMLMNSGCSRMSICMQSFEFWFDDDKAMIEKVGLGSVLLRVRSISCLDTYILVRKTFSRMFVIKMYEFCWYLSILLIIYNLKRSENIILFQNTQIIYYLSLTCV